MRAMFNVLHPDIPTISIFISGKIPKYNSTFA